MNLADQNRAESWATLKRDVFDVLVVGGGIVGTGVARDAAMRGLRVALLDAHDFAFGTSSRSSRLLHGGLRYLAQGRVGLVREASLEKRVVHKIAPHLAQPLAFVFPTYRGGGVPLWKLRVGVRMYDLLCSGRNLGKCSSLRPAAAVERLPGLDADGLAGAVRYYDALTNDARLVLDTLSSARRAGAVLLNYARVGKCEFSENTWSVEVEDRSDAVGSEDHADVKAHAIVNATGPWAHGFAHSAVKLRRTKGVHLVVDRSRLPVGDAVVMTEGSRILFVIPWGERVILGTTDTDYDGPLEDVRTLPEDVGYVLRITNDLFPETKLTEADVLSHWAGLRPLIADPNGNPSDVSRSHEIRRPRPFWWDVAGGKLTTYRLMAEQTVDRVADELGLSRRLARCRTADEPLLPDGDPAREYSGVVPPPVSAEAVAHYCDREQARRLDDVMLRRSSWGYYEHDDAAVAERVAGWMAGRLGWDEDRTRREVEAYHGLPVRPTAARPLSA